MSCVIPSVWVRQRSTVCALQPPPFSCPLDATTFVPSLCGPLLSGRLPFTLPSSCMLLNLVLSKEPLPHIPITFHRLSQLQNLPYTQDKLVPHIP